MEGYKHINKIGSELESGWYKPRNDLIADGSLRNGEFTNKCVCIGELVTPAFEDKTQLYKFLQDNYPDESTARCSMHVHVSVNSLGNYTSCMSPKFYNDYFLPAMNKWGKDYPCKSKLFWNRLEDGNQYCRKLFFPDKQVKLKQKGTTDRYTHLNFAYSMHKTIECRLFPMFEKAETAISAIEALLDCFEGYLEKFPEPEEINVSGTVLDESNLDEELKDQEFKIDEPNSPIKIAKFNYFECADIEGLKRSVERNIYVEPPKPVKPRAKKSSFNDVFGEPMRWGTTSTVNDLINNPFVPVVAVNDDEPPW